MRRKARSRAHVRSGAQHQPTPEQPTPQGDLVSAVDEALAAAHPLAMLELVSSFAGSLDPRTSLRDTELRDTERTDTERTDTELPDEGAPVTFDELVESWVEVSLPQTSALLAVVAAVTTDEVLRSRIRAILADRRHQLPGWLRNLELVPGEVAEMTDTFGDGDDILIGAQLTPRHELTVLVYIDHNVGTIVKDAFVIPQPLGTVVTAITDDLAGSDQDVHRYDPADARARVEEAVAKAAVTYPPFETDTWPACRPLLEWVLRRLPAGGRGHRRPQWSQHDLRALTDDFVRSGQGGGWDDADSRALLGALYRFAADDGSGDPMRWSPVVVELLLADWAPRRLFDDRSVLGRLPDLLRAFITYCHRRRGIAAHLTAQTLEAVRRYEDGYQHAIREPRDSGLLEVLDRVGALGRPGHEVQVEVSFDEYMLEALARAVGGADALERLDAEPLQDEAFEWGGVPADIQDRVAEVLKACDRVCDDRLGGEYRTACRRLLSAVAAGDPVIFRRKGAAGRAAAAICWLVGKANELVGYGGRMQSRQLLEWFGVKGSVSQRAEPMLRAVGIDPHAQFGIVDLGSPRYLTAARRAEIIRRRDHYRDSSGRLE